MTPPQHQQAIDQVARDIAREAVSLVHQHEAVCLEAEKRRTAFQEEMRGWLARIQTSWETGQNDMSQRHSKAINTLGENLSSMNKTLMDRMEGIAKALNDHKDQDTELFSQLSGKLNSSKSFLTGGWKALAVVAGVLYAVVQTGLAAYSAFHH